MKLLQEKKTLLSGSIDAANAQIAEYEVLTGQVYDCIRGYQEELGQIELALHILGGGDA